MKIQACYSYQEHHDLSSGDDNQNTIKIPSVLSTASCHNSRYMKVKVFQIEHIGMELYFGKRKARTTMIEYLSTKPYKYDIVK